jgi:carbonic anhydrase/acetyltransferase-like protein (isoleucine patch superfamily)
MPCYEIEGKSPQLPEDNSCWIAPTADVIGDARLGREVGVWFGVVIRADNTAIVVGDRTNIQEGAMLHSDPDAPLAIGTDCTIGHHAILHGCTLGDGVLIGMGATIMNGAVIGDYSLVGAGALVTEGKIFPPGSLIMGAPAKAVRELDPAVRETLLGSARSYADKRRIYASGLRRLPS